MAIPQAYIAANPTSGTAVIVNVETALPTNKQSNTAVVQYTTTLRVSICHIWLKLGLGWHPLASKSADKKRDTQELQKCGQATGPGIRPRICTIQLH